MWPLIAAAAAPVIAGAFGAYGQESANKANAKEAAMARDFNAREAEKNRQFQDSQSSTAYQRKVKDLEKAGLNPALAYEGGGAQAMSGSAASGTGARMESSLGAGLSSAGAAARIKEDVLDARQRRLESAARTAQSVEQADLTRAQRDQVRSMMDLQMQEAVGRIGLSSAQAQNLRQRYTLDAQRQEWERDLSIATRRRQEAQLPGDVARSQLYQLGIPAAKNAAAAAGTAWGRYVAPYLSDANTVSRIFTPWALWAGR